MAAGTNNLNPLSAKKICSSRYRSWGVNPTPAKNKEPKKKKKKSNN